MKYKEQGEMNTKEKIINFWDYHKFHILIGILAVAFVVFTAVECNRRKNPDLCIGYVSYDYRDHTILEQELSKEVGDDNGDGRSYVMVDSVVMNEIPVTDQDSMLAQKVSVMFVSGDYRMYIMDKEFFEVEMYNEMFMDLSDLISEDVKENAYKIMGKPIAVKTTDCKFLQDVKFSGEELYVGLTAIADPDRGNKNVDAEVETAKKALKILIEGNKK